MERKLRVLGLVGLFGAMSIVMAQVAAPLNQGGQKQPTGQRSGAAGAANGTHSRERLNRSKGTHPFAEPNVIQVAMNYALTGKHNYLIAEAESMGFKSYVGSIIRVNCYTTLTLMRPDQQQHEMHDVWQVDDWVKGDPNWDAVRKAPSLVNELLKVDSAALANVQREFDRQASESIAPYQGVVARLRKDPAFDRLTRDEQIRLVHREYANLNAGKTKLELSGEHAKMCDRMLAVIRENLTTEPQKAEFDLIVGNFNRDMAIVFKGGTPTSIRP